MGRRKERFCGQGRTCPGQGPGDECIQTRLGQILPWLTAGKQGARLVGYPGRRGQGARPERWVARCCGPIPPAEKRFLIPSAAAEVVSCRQCFVFSSFSAGLSPLATQKG